jgi:hypothetical protein
VHDVEVGVGPHHGTCIDIDAEGPEGAEMEVGASGFEDRGGGGVAVQLMHPLGVLDRDEREVAEEPSCLAVDAEGLELDLRQDGEGLIGGVDLGATGHLLG